MLKRKVDIIPVSVSTPSPKKGRIVEEKSSSQLKSVLAPLSAYVTETPKTARNRENAIKDLQKAKFAHPISQDDIKAAISEVRKSLTGGQDCHPLASALAIRLITGQMPKSLARNDYDDFIVEGVQEEVEYKPGKKYWTSKDNYVREGHFKKINKITKHLEPMDGKQEVDVEDSEDFGNPTAEFETKKVNIDSLEQVLHEDITAQGGYAVYFVTLSRCSTQKDNIGKPEKHRICVYGFTKDAHPCLYFLDPQNDRSPFPIIGNHLRELGYQFIDIEKDIIDGLFDTRVEMVRLGCAKSDQIRLDRMQDLPFKKIKIEDEIPEDETPTPSLISAAPIMPPIESPPVIAMSSEPDVIPPSVLPAMSSSLLPEVSSSLLPEVSSSLLPEVSSSLLPVMPGVLHSDIPVELIALWLGSKIPIGSEGSRVSAAISSDPSSSARVITPPAAIRNTQEIQNSLASASLRATQESERKAPILSHPKDIKPTVQSRESNEEANIPSYQLFKRKRKQGNGKSSIKKADPIVYAKNGVGFKAGDPAPPGAKVDHKKFISKNNYYNRIWLNKVVNAKNGKLAPPGTKVDGEKFITRNTYRQRKRPNEVVYAEGLNAGKLAPPGTKVDGKKFITKTAYRNRKCTRQVVYANDDGEHKAGDLAPPGTKADGEEFITKAVFYKRQKQKRDVENPKLSRSKKGKEEANIPSCKLFKRKRTKGNRTPRIKNTGPQVGYAKDDSEHKVDSKALSPASPIEDGDDIILTKNGCKSGKKRPRKQQAVYTKNDGEHKAASKALATASPIEDSDDIILTKNGYISRPNNYFTLTKNGYRSGKKGPLKQHSVNAKDDSEHTAGSKVPAVRK